jgi:hypothetical protein
VVQSKGIKIDNFYIPPFKLDKGDIVVIQLPSGPYFSGLLFRLVDILTGKEKNENVELTAGLKFVNQVIETGWSRIFRPLTVERYIKRRGNPASELTQRVYETKDLKPKTRISRLPGNPRKLLSLLTTLSWTDKIIFDLAGVDPVGGQEVFNLVKRQISNSGATILIDLCDQFKDDCTTLIKFEQREAEKN